MADRKQIVIWWYVYKAINHTKRDIYHGVSKDPVARRDGAHCKGHTKATRGWHCENHDINWLQMSRHKTQTMASRISHRLERTSPPPGYNHIRTAGI